MYKNVISLILVATTLIVAHPHMFIDVMVKFMLNDTSLDGFYVHWDFDEMNSASILEEFDLDKNNHLEKNEYEKIEQELFSYAVQHNFFISFRWALKSLRVQKACEFKASIVQKKILRYSFFIPCDILLADFLGHDVVIGFDDPSMFVAFAIKQDMVQIKENKYWDSNLSLKKIDYVDKVILTIKQKK